MGIVWADPKNARRLVLRRPASPAVPLVGHASPRDAFSSSATIRRVRSWVAVLLPARTQQDRHTIDVTALHALGRVHAAVTTDLAQPSRPGSRSRPPRRPSRPTAA